MSVQRRVVCTANKYKLTSGESMFFVGVRHFCPVMRQNMQPYKDIIIRDSEVQGFVDQFGVFMDRSHALHVADNASQLNIARPKTWPENELFSEDLY